MRNCKGERFLELAVPLDLEQIYLVVFFKREKKWLLGCHLGRDGACLAVKGLLVLEHLPGSLPSSQLVARVLREAHAAWETLVLSDVVERWGSKASANFDPKQTGVSRRRELQVAKGCSGALRIIPQPPAKEVGWHPTPQLFPPPWVQSWRRDRQSLVASDLPGAWRERAATGFV